MLEHDAEMRAVLETLLAEDLEITARAVARLHPTLKAASSITRSDTRNGLLAEYRQRQLEYRKWRGRAGKTSKEDLAAALVIKDQCIAELESKVLLLTTSHVALLRAVGAIGGFAKWANFFKEQQTILRNLDKYGALPEKVTPIDLEESKKIVRRKDSS